MRVAELFAFMKERHCIYVRKEEQKLPKPWTKDIILQNYRFCNIYRELDTVTKWIAENWREPNQEDPNLWLALVIARFINWPATLAEMGYPNFSSKKWQERLFCVLENKMCREEKTYTGAYMVRGGTKGDSKARYLVYEVFRPLWEERETLRPYETESFFLWRDAMEERNGIGSFLAGQFIADLKYSKPYLNVPDWWTFATSGPGSRRGLNRMLDRELRERWKEDEWLRNLLLLKDKVDPLLLKANMPKMHAQDLQNCLCEWDKYERVRLGQGKPRSRYKGI